MLQHGANPCHAPPQTAPASPPRVATTGNCHPQPLCCAPLLRYASPPLATAVRIHPFASRFFKSPTNPSMDGAASPATYAFGRLDPHHRRPCRRSHGHVPLHRHLRPPALIHSRVLYGFVDHDASAETQACLAARWMDTGQAHPRRPGCNPWLIGRRLEGGVLLLPTKLDVGRWTDSLVFEAGPHEQWLASSRRQQEAATILN
ncbi:uncharacterized protein [Triticum aestivum]|uniref:uncharacterized protein n=1 Tax=Triticum aestivum TaxID=4565 RepID=UPI001D019194|nr:uncharacterized protein LOC123086040 [Triticum aestivum]